MGYYPSLREYVHTLESREKLFRIQREVCRETELHPLVRWQFRGLRKASGACFYLRTLRTPRPQIQDVSSVLGLRFLPRDLCLGHGLPRGRDLRSLDQCTEKSLLACDKALCGVCDRGVETAG
ncbi:MAG TPA: hypothetical protein VFS81_22060 [Candidatus Binatia bacterium]|nr:hypothetical protein [Candidatus Binatia bacterium]